MKMFKEMSVRNQAITLILGGGLVGGTVCAGVSAGADTWTISNAKSYVANLTEMQNAGATTYNVKAIGWDGQRNQVKMVEMPFPVAAAIAEESAVITKIQNERPKEALNSGLIAFGLVAGLMTCLAVNLGAFKKPELQSVPANN